MENLQELLKNNNLSNAVILDTSHDFQGFWKDFIIENDFKDRKKAILTLWDPFKSKLPKTFSLIENNLENIFVIKYNNEIKLIYVFVVNSNTLVYEGRQPIQNHPFLENIPFDIRKFYIDLHNGWFESISGALGFLSLDEIQFLDELEWGILDEIEAPNVDLSKTYFIFHNAGSGYLCINIENISEPRYLIWWTHKEPKYDIEFWSFIDAWIEIGLTN